MRNTGGLLDSVFTHGLLAGRGFDAGANGRGVWGLYGVYDYFSPELFRISTTALSLGTSTQWWTPGGFGLQVSGVAGVGYSAAQTLQDGGGNYHYGVTPQMTTTMRLTAGNRAALVLLPWNRARNPASAYAFALSGLDRLL